MRPFARRHFRILAWLGALLPSLALAAPAVESFTPSGTVKSVRQVQVRFATPMVAFGDPRLPAPFDIDCPAEGTARWVDPRRWVYDFARELPAGLRCSFGLREDLRDAAGAPLADPRKYRFDTGGPAIVQSEPWEGGTIDEEQIFILGLDAAAVPESVIARAQCRVDGLVEASGVRLVTGDARRRVLDANPYFLRRYVSALYKNATDSPWSAIRAADEPAVRARFRALIEDPDSPLVLVQCRQRLPNGAKVWLDWGAGITTPTGLATRAPQSLQFETREAFRARFHCERMNQDADCIPALGMSLEFTAAVPVRDAARITLTAAGGRVYPVRTHADANVEHTWGVSFHGPLPQRTRFTLQVPPLQDDAGRVLSNQDRFPLAVATDDDPPLAKFAADFGVIELNGNPALPVTVRNLDANLRRQPAPAVRTTQPPSVSGFVRELVGSDEPDLLRNPVSTTLRGRVLKFAATDPATIGHWLTALRAAQRNHYTWDAQAERYVVTRRAGATSLLDTRQDAQPFEVPRAAHAKAFEVVGIPLAKPGFYLVELASPRLGAALFGKPGVYYAQSLALVTNLGVHLKWGRESSLVWVTALDTGRPVSGAAVTLRDCRGDVHWQGRTDQEGVAAVDIELPQAADLPRCDWSSQGLIASAQVGDDVGVVSSEWNEGIENWQFNLPGPDARTPEIGTTVFDRTLFRTGETVHMKHVLRAHTRYGFSGSDVAPFTVRIRHAGSDDEFPLAAKFDRATSSAESIWPIPSDARQGTYRVEYRTGDAWTPLGEFRVESYRVPLLRATLDVAATPAVAASTLDLDLQLQYLAGGAAGGLPVKMRGLVQPRDVRFEDYADFVFMNGNVAEGITDQAEQAWSARRYATAPQAELLDTLATTLDAEGGARVTLRDLPRRETAQTLLAELEYQDPNGEILTAATRVPLWPSKILLGLKPDGWALSQAGVKFAVQALTLDGRPAAGVAVVVDLFQRSTYSHRKRLIGGFYGYENTVEVKPLDARCAGSTDGQGRLLCEVRSPVAGNVILRASATDADGNASYANRDVWVGGDDDWWFGASDEDRMDVLPERRQYEPGDTARLQVRMPFRHATALVSVEREGVVERFVTRLSGQAPLVEVPLRGHHAPNVFVSVLAVRGRDTGALPTALVDLGKPAYKLGITELKVGWRAHTLNVKVQADRETYRTRGTARVAFDVRAADGGALGPRAELAVAAVDEGLLELHDNDSWDLLSAMMGRRGTEVRTATAQMQIVGKRHFGRKAVIPGGGGGHANGTRQLFDTLLAWHARVPLDARGKAMLDIPLNDSLTGYRIVAVATAGDARFGTGSTRVRTTQDVMLFAGLPPVVRESDRFSARFTLRNTTDRVLTLSAAPRVEIVTAEGGTPKPEPFDPQIVTLPAGAAQELAWETSAPLGAESLRWNLEVFVPESPALRDALTVVQTVRPVVPVRTFQAGLSRLSAPLTLPVAAPAEAIPGRGGVQIELQPQLAGALGGVRAFMNEYPYSCLEQRVSRAVALQDPAAWERVMALLPAHLDSHGLARYFAGEGPGSDSLSAYILAIAHESGWTVPDAARTRLRDALMRFIEGRLSVESAWQTADLTLRRLAAIEALSRYPEGIDVRWLDALDIEPDSWPTSGVLDWIDILRRVARVPARTERLAHALAVLRARISFQGATMTFSTERDDALWWLMANADVNANRALLSVLDLAEWRDDVPRLVTGSLGRQVRGHWLTTNANAWGVLALKRFSARFEATPVGGTTRVALAGAQRAVDWDTAPRGLAATLPWPASPATLTSTHDGVGAPWLGWQARAALPLREPLTAGYRIRRRMIPIEQRRADGWHRGDVYRVRLEITAQSDMTWVVVDDPIPAGAAILGTNSPVLAGDAASQGVLRPVFEERTFTAFRAYYAHVPQGDWVVEYTVRLNNPGEFSLPATRVEALYAPGMFAELPNDRLRVRP